MDGVVHYAVDHTPALFYKSTSEAISHVLPPYLNDLISGTWNGNEEALIAKDGSIVSAEINEFLSKDKGVIHGACRH